MIREAVAAAARPSVKIDAASGKRVPRTEPEQATAPPRWTLKRLVVWLQDRFGLRCCRETVRKALKTLGFSWKKAKALLNRANTAAREAFVEQVQAIMTRVLEPKPPLLVYMDEAHIHQDADLGYGWAPKGERLWVGSHSPGLSAKVSLYGLYFYNLGQVEIWDYERANTAHTLDVLRRVRHRTPDQEIILFLDGAPYHRSHAVREEADKLAIQLVPLPSYSPDFMPVEALWRWMREDVTYHHCHASRDELMARVRHFEQTINATPTHVADRLWTKTSLDPEEEKLRISC